MTTGEAAYRVGSHDHAIRVLAAVGRKIAAIKLIRTLAGCTLSEAVRTYDEYYAKFDTGYIRINVPYGN